MPNHVTTVCTVTGPDEDLRVFVERHLVEKGEFSFTTVIPRPAILDDTESGSDADIGMAALVGDVVWTDFKRFGYIPPEVLAGAPYGHARAVRKWLAETRPVTLKKGRKCLQAVAETGYPNWYEWSIGNWGVKWDAYDNEFRSYEADRCVFKFETAWSFPEPVFRKLAEMYPKLVFSVLSFDEGSNFACDGEFNGADNYRCSVELATDEMYERVYGHKRYEDDED